MTASRRKAQWALVTVLLSAVLGWVLYVAAMFSDIAVATGRSADLLGDVPGADVFTPSRYLIFAGIAVFGLGSLLAKRRMQRMLAAGAPVSALAKPVQEFAGTAMIIALILSTLAAVTVFLDGFLSTPGVTDLKLRVLNLYLPIVLYTALAVTVLLAGFVFGRYQRPSPTENPPAAAAAGQGAAVPAAAAAPEPVDPSAQRSVALAFATPIIAVAVALIFGLIVFDVTQTALEVWIWVIVQAFIGVGIVGGTHFARKGMDAQTAVGRAPAGASVAAKNLVLVLSIIFAAAVTLMSLGYGSAAVEQLRVQPYLALNSYQSSAKEFQDPSQPTPLETATVQVNGSDLKRNSAATVRVEPGGSLVVETTADRDGYLYAEERLPADLAPGDYTLDAQAVSSDDTLVEISLDFSVSDDGGVTFPRGSDAYSSADAAHLMPVSANWFFGDLLPALVLLLLAASTIFATLTLRNRENAQSPRAAQRSR